MSSKKAKLVNSSPEKPAPSTGGLQSSRWANPNEGSDKANGSAREKTEKPFSRRRSSSGKSKNDETISDPKVNALAARLGMVDIRNEESRTSKVRPPASSKGQPREKARRESSSKGNNAVGNSKSVNSATRKSTNPLAARLGMVDVGESSEDNDSEELSRPSTSDRKSIFDRIKPARITPEPHSSKSSPKPQDTHRSELQTNAHPTKHSKTDILKRKIEEQKKIREANVHKARQSDLLQNFLNDDAYTNWDEEV
ncbi:LANO_0F13366g1_1 [Lachancea nothofagi CBS 11611]|uniref:LANO_0F13366g1_1 n=1 Tax=Lachancea nothofagi CBS 11611 TaxID=1266666 RepID=A0A1G4KBU1_9SACH|nr:LANO_0F13366g1_1 [Lachancea nothofagi CBS 11611]